ncbi:MAG TPA: tetratricopeptide repeat protein [Tepidisphaeraceae bacterium]|jgi:Tfp pilus assembly protein PilF
MTSPLAHDPRRRRDFAVLAAVLLGTFALYLPILQNDFVNYDDPKYVTENPTVQRGLTLDGVRWAFTTDFFSNWLPVTWLSHMLDVSLFGLWAGGHHATSAALHAINAVLVLIVVSALTGSRQRALAAAVLFAVHPLRVESVAWVAERKDVLAGTFFLLALWAYVAWTRRRAMIWYVAAVVAHALGLMSKTMLVTLPCVLLLLDVWPLRRAETIKWWRLALEKLPFFALAAIAATWTFVLQRDGGAMGLTTKLPLGGRLSNAVVAVPRYLAKTVWPSDLSVLYIHPGGWPLGIALAAAALIVAITVVAWRKRRAQPYLLMGWLWFCGMLVPVIGVVQVGIQAMADRYMYLPGIGLIVAVVWGVSEHLSRRRAPPWAGAALTAAVAVALGLLTLRQERVWRNNDTLFTQALAADENNWLALIHLAPSLVQRGEIARAADYYERSIRLRPDHYQSRYNFANLLARGGNLPAAAAEYSAAIKIDPTKAEAHYNLGVLDARRGDRPLAAARFAEAVRLQPDNTDARVALATALAALGDLPAAEREAAEAVRRAPGNARATRALADIRAKPGGVE